MAYFENYNPAPLRANIVPKEGVYLCKVDEVVQGTMDDGKRYVQVKCLVKSEGTPVVSIFLTEGANFDGNLTAFYDTFAIPRGSMDSNEWKGKYGYLKITLVKKGEYTNMVPRYILDEYGYVKKPAGQHTQQTANPIQTSAGYGEMRPSDGGELEDYVS